MDLVTESISIMMYGDAIGYGTFTSLLQYYGQINDESVMGDAEIVYPTVITVTGAGFYKFYASKYLGTAIMVDWGDGTVEVRSTTDSNYNFEHTYTENTTHNITITAQGGSIDIDSEQAIYDDVKATEIVLGTDVREFGDLYSDRSSLTSAIFKNPDTIVGYLRDSFINCTMLTHVELPSHLVILYGRTFENSGIPQIELPATVTSIRDEAFKDCTSLAEVTVLATTPPTLGTDVFDGCTALTAIYVPSDSVAAYQSAWSDYSSIIQAIS